MQNLHFEDIVLCGDFNCVLNNDSDISSGENDAQGTVTKFNDVLNECNLFDTWRLFNPDIKEYTWSKRNPFAAKRFGLYFHRFPRVCVFFWIKQENAILFRS